MSSKTFMVYDKNGSPLRTVTCPEGEVQAQLQSGETARPYNTVKLGTPGSSSFV